MDFPRSSSVYDFSALRVHPDGSRVRKTTDNLALGNHTSVIHTPHRGWIAKDAGGSRGIPLYELNKKHRLAPGNENKSENDKVGEFEIGDGDSDSEKQEEEGRRIDGRPDKRRKFYQDDSYISKPARMAGDSKDKPPSDLLKSIHYLSSNYYKKRGLLSSTPKKYLRKANKEKFVQWDFPSSGSSGKHDGAEEANSSTTERSELGPEVSSIEQPETLARAENDSMYRVFEGSLLLGIGVLAQEKTSQLLQFKTSQRVSQHTILLDTSKQGVAGSDSGNQKQTMEDVESEGVVDGVENERTETVDFDKEWNKMPRSGATTDDDREAQVSAELLDSLECESEAMVISDIRDYWTEIYDDGSDEFTEYTTEEERDEIDSDR